MNELWSNFKHPLDALDVYLDAVKQKNCGKKELNRNKKQE